MTDNPFPDPISEAAEADAATYVEEIVTDAGLTVALVLFAKYARLNRDVRDPGTLRRVFDAYAAGGSP